jgi:hypothetical protein
LVKRQGRAALTRKISAVAVLVLGFSSVLQLFSAGPANGQSCAKDVPIPDLRGSTRVIQLVNCTNETILGTANAAGRFPNPPTSVFPREGTWVMEPVGSGKNFLTIDIPPQWLSTGPEKSLGPNFWARTGCRYDVAANPDGQGTGIAQCETGGAGGRYDVSKARIGGKGLGPPGGATITEWNMAQVIPRQGGGTYLRDNFDVSAVNGANLTVDIEPVGCSALDPGNPQSITWLVPNDKIHNSPLAVHGQDLRTDENCLPDFRLKRSDLTGIPKPPFNQTVFGYVIVDDSGQPQGGDRTVACFNNCGKYKFPLEPLPTCDLSDTKCLGWNVFCAGNGTKYGQHCMTDADCQQQSGVHASCWQNPGSATNNTCQLRGFIAAETCPDDVCTFPYGYVNPFSGVRTTSTQPPLGHCSDVFPTNTDSQCIGEDRVHKVFPRAYSWPNDPQVYDCDAPLYRVVFAPGGTSVPITPAQNSLPACVHLPKIYGYNEQTLVNCSVPVAAGAQYAIAHPSGSGQNWGCNLGAGAGDEGVICRWNASLTNPPGVFVGDPHQSNCVAESQQALIATYGSLKNAATQYGFPPGFGNEGNLSDAITSWCRSNP